MNGLILRCSKIPRRHRVLPDARHARRGGDHDDPDRHPAGLQEPGGPGLDLLRRHAGRAASRKTSRTGWSGGSGRPTARRGRSRARSSGRASSATTSASDVDPNGALTQVNSLALAAVPNLPPGTLAAGGPPLRPDQHDARLHRRGRQPRWQADRVDPLRRGAVRGPQHAHEHQRRHCPGRLRRQDPRRASPTSTARSSRPAGSRRST